MKVYYHLFPKLTDSPVVSTADSKPPPKLSFLNYLVSLTLFPVLFKYVLLLAHHRHSHHRPLSTKKHTRRGIKHIWPDSAAIWEANYFPPYIQCQFVRKKKKLSQNLHFLSSPLLPNFLSSVFHDHQNTAIILSKVTCYLLFFTVFILELCWFPRGWPSPLLHLSLPCFSFDLVTLQFWFTSSFSNQLLNVSPDSLSHPCRWVLSKVPLLGLSSFCLNHFLVGVGNFYINSERQIQKLTRAT